MGAGRQAASPGARLIPEPASVIKTTRLANDCTGLRLLVKNRPDSRGRSLAVFGIIATRLDIEGERIALKGPDAHGKRTERNHHAPLPRVRKTPAQYLGGELNSIVKDHRQVRRNSVWRSPTPIS